MDKETEAAITNLVAMVRVLSDGMIGLMAQVETLKDFVCEMHPEAKTRFELMIQESNRVAREEHAKLQRQLELLLTATTTKMQ